MTRFEFLMKIEQYKNGEITEMDMIAAAQAWEKALIATKPFVSSRFCPPYRVGKKQKRAVLDSKGLEVVIFPEHTPALMVIEYCMFLNNQHINQQAQFLEKLLVALNENLKLKNGV